METKLTLKLDSVTINRAKRYIGRQKGYSLSKLVESYLKSLTSEQVSDETIPPIVASLAGVAKVAKGGNVRKEYTTYLIEKYR